MLLISLEIARPKDYKNKIAKIPKIIIALLSYY